MFALNKAEIKQRSAAYKEAETKEAKNAIKARLTQERRNKGRRVMRCQLLQFQPNPEQAHCMMIWFKDARRTYNQIMAYILEQKYHRNVPNLKQLESTLRDRFVTAKEVIKRPKDCVMLRTPKVIRQQAMKAVITVLKAHETRVEKNNALRLKFPDAIKFKAKIKFNPGFKRKGNWNRDSISLELKSLRVESDGLFSLYRNLSPALGEKQQSNVQEGCQRVFRSAPRFSKYPTRNIKLKSTVELASLDKDFKIHRRNGKWFLILPRTVQIEPNSVDDDQDDVCAIDPGVRKPFVTYSPQGRVEIIGANVKKVANRSFRRLDRLKSKVRIMASRLESIKLAPQLRGMKRSSRKKARGALLKWRARYRKAELKQRNIAKNFHYNVAHHLLRRYRTIILPNTSIHKCRKGRRLHPKTKRTAMFLSLGQFRRRLIETASYYVGATIIQGSEAYTSKQCGQCGTLNDNLGSSETFTCPHCNARGDRDVHAARNILLRFLEQ
jgi:transposase